MTTENEISGRRVVGFVAFALAALVGTLAFATLLASPRPGVAEPTPTFSVSSQPGPTTSAPGRPGSPGSVPTIPPFVPIPSGPFP